MILDCEAPFDKPHKVMGIKCTLNTLHAIQCSYFEYIENSGASPTLKNSHNDIGHMLTAICKVIYCYLSLAQTAIAM